MKKAICAAFRLALVIQVLIFFVGCGGNSSSDTEEDTNVAPVADAGGPYTCSTGETISLSGALSADSDGSITSYAWDLDNDGWYDDAIAVTADFSASTAGTYTVGLQVTDNSGASGTDTATVTVIEKETSVAGYNLFSALNDTTAYLIDNDGSVVHTWSTGYRPGNAMYLLENGNLLRTGNVGNTTFNGGGEGGIVQMFDWDGNVVWSYDYSDTTHLQHHDVEMLPNGNVLMIAWQYKSEAEAIAAGRNPSLLNEGELWPDSVIEVQPDGADGGVIVWEWHLWDHLVQDYDATNDNYGVVEDHPELVDVNYVMTNGNADWTHINSVDYNAELDQIVLSVHNFSEIWIIDHSTTTEEAAGHTGGNSGKGGDLLYRWGNPQAYGAGTSSDQKLFVQHDAEWIGDGYPGEGNILIFNNGGGRSDGDYSTIDEITPPLNEDGSYSFTAGSSFGPDSLAWTYVAETPTSFYARNISGQQRLADGNTLICDGPSGHFFEVTDTGETVWEYTTTGMVFRVERYTSDYPGFDGTSLDDALENRPPVAEAGGPYSGFAGNAILLDGSGSSAGSATIVTYDWDLDNDGQYDDATGITATFSSDDTGNHPVGLQVTDSNGNTDTDSATVVVSENNSSTLSYPVVDTGQTVCYDDSSAISTPTTGSAFYGQDAQHDGNQPVYSVSSDGLTVYDSVTGLTWTKSPDIDNDGDIDADDKLVFSEFQSYPATLNAQNFGGYSDWRLPTIKDLYSLMNFTGMDPDPMSTDTSGLTPFIDTRYFDFGYGDTDSGERIIDAQFWSSNQYVANVFDTQSAAFGLNLADGRIKGYPTSGGPVTKTCYVYFVRGNAAYGVNAFQNNGDGTITDTATGLMWSETDSGTGMNWEDALAWVEQKNSENHLGYSDWRLPNAKEMQSIVDYTRAPDATASAAIDPVFSITMITNEDGASDYPWFWTGTTHVRSGGSGSAGVYICFGRAMGYMNSSWMDVHGAGAQRSDRKGGDFTGLTYVADGYYLSVSPQGDATRIYNYVRLVR